MTHARTTRQHGFTIIELTVVLGLLSIFMMFLIQIVFTTTEVFQSGQAEQEMSAKLVAAHRPIEESLRSMIGPSREDKRAASDARFVVQWAPTGFLNEDSIGRVQVLRATVRVPKRLERELLAAKFRSAAIEEVGEHDPQELATVVRTMVQRKGFQGRGEMVLVPWPAGDPEGAYFDLRRGVWLPDAGIRNIREIGGPDLSAKEILAHTEMVATGLLHVAYRMSSQYTKNWTDGPDAKGPELVWDSARAGWLTDGDDATERFTLDLGSLSAKDSTDDVFPRYVEVTVVAARGAQELPEALLDMDIGSEDTTIQLIDTDRLPTTVHDNFLKIGSEWVQFGNIRGRTLTGVKRGMRGTARKSHDRRTGVRAGKTDVLMIKVLHGRDSWNG